MQVAARAVRLGGWAVVAGLGVLAALRTLAWDAAIPVLIGLHGLGPLPYLAAMPVAVAALARRHVRLGLLALVVGAVALPTGLPEVVAATPLPVGIQAAPRLRILSWNLYEQNTDGDAMDRVIGEATADVVVLQEVSVRNIGGLERSAALSAYPYRFVTDKGAFGSGIWSRFPLEGAREIDVSGRPMSVAIVVTPAGPVRLVNVHTLSPVTPDGLERWPRQLRFLGQEVDRPGPPLVMAGDFNATWGHRKFRDLLDSGLSDAAAARSQGWTTTWPANGKILPVAALRLDHVLTGRGLVATSYATGSAGGSDHRSIVVDIAQLAAS